MPIPPYKFCQEGYSTSEFTTSSDPIAYETTNNVNNGQQADINMMSTDVWCDEDIAIAPVNQLVVNGINDDTVQEHEEISWLQHLAELPDDDNPWLTDKEISDIVSRLGAERPSPCDLPHESRPSAITPPPHNSCINENILRHATMKGPCFIIPPYALQHVKGPSPSVPPIYHYANLFTHLE